MKPLEALERIKNTQIKSAFDFDYIYIKDDRKKEVEIIETQLKALEIIVKKYVDIAMVNACENAKNYNAWCDTGVSWSNEYLSQEEFDLLKEVLK